MAGTRFRSREYRRRAVGSPLRRRGSYLARQQRLLRLLDERKELSVDHAAAELGCSRRTVYRDFLVLSETGVPLYQEPEGRRVRWRLPRVPSPAKRERDRERASPPPSRLCGSCATASASSPARPSPCAAWSATTSTSPAAPAPIGVNHRRAAARRGRLAVRRADCGGQRIARLVAWGDRLPAGAALQSLPPAR
ncbi:MAG: HTH domain-containing protein [Deltaproteobacteria bacterium]|nr:HTH domain-containing protein [Deltaproteobacteria bacterium]